MGTDDGEAKGMTVTSISVTSGIATPEEAAALAAAVERFRLETTPAAAAAKTMNPWLRAALVEGVSAKQVAVQPHPGSGLLFGQE